MHRKLTRDPESRQALWNPDWITKLSTPAKQTLCLNIWKVPKESENQFYFFF